MTIINSVQTSTQGEELLNMSSAAPDTTNYVRPPSPVLSALDAYYISHRRRKYCRRSPLCFVATTPGWYSWVEQTEDCQDLGSRNA